MSRLASRYSLGRWAAAAILLLGGGCSGEPDYPTIPTFPAGGSVIVNGVPAEGAIVRLYPLAKQEGVDYPLMPSGKADAKGEYRLTTYEGEDGAPPGRYRVTLEWTDPAWRPPGGGMPPPPPDRLLEKYADWETSKIEVEVVAGDNRFPPIVIEGASILEGSSLPGQAASTATAPPRPQGPVPPGRD